MFPIVKIALSLRIYVIYVVPEIITFNRKLFRLLWKFAKTNQLYRFARVSKDCAWIIRVLQVSISLPHCCDFVLIHDGMPPSAAMICEAINNENLFMIITGFDYCYLCKRLLLVSMFAYNCFPEERLFALLKISTYVNYKIVKTIDEYRHVELVILTLHIW